MRTSLTRTHNKTNTHALTRRTSSRAQERACITSSAIATLVHVRTSTISHAFVRFLCQHSLKHKRCKSPHTHTCVHALCCTNTSKIALWSRGTHGHLRARFECSFSGASAFSFPAATLQFGCAAGPELSTGRLTCTQDAGRNTYVLNV